MSEHLLIPAEEEVAQDQHRDPAGVYAWHPCIRLEMLDPDASRFVEGEEKVQLPNQI